MDNASETEFKSPPRKLVRFFNLSRDLWKDKYKELRIRFKKEQNQVRAVEKSREFWRLRAELAERQLEQLRIEAEPKKNAH